MGSAWDWGGRASFALAAAATVATPLRPRGRRAGLANAVVAGLGGSSFARGATRWSPPRALASACVVGGLTLAVERTGTGTGFPFGHYEYTGALRPAVFGVPAAVPVAWFALGLPARETAHAVLGPRSTPVRRIAVASLCLTAWDAFLDPQMVGEGYWRWSRRGRYRGIPATNFAGWVATASAVMAVFERALPPVVPDPALIAMYAFVGVMSTVGHAVFFGDPLAALVGGAAMVPPAIVALRRVRG